MKESEDDAKRYAVHTGAKSFLYIGSDRNIWSFRYPGGNVKLQTAADLKLYGK